MTLEMVAQRVSNHLARKLFQRPCHGLPFCFHQGALKELGPQGQVWAPRLTLEDITATDWMWL